jgi:hypothetical protein
VSVWQADTNRAIDAIVAEMVNDWKPQAARCLGDSSARSAVIITKAASAKIAIAAK